MSRTSAFAESGFKEVVADVVEEMKALYLADDIPWVVGYSGGKDSTAVLQLVWTAMRGLAPAERRKPVHVISTDTLVENPVVARWVATSLERMAEAAGADALPIEPHRLTPDVANTFWVSLIGRGYPAPRPKFRWCTERLKIKPSNSFIRRVVRENGEAILVLGTRKAESSSRRHRMEQLEGARVRDRLSPNESLPNSLVYSPIEDWTNDDVWLYLMQVPNAWGYDNKDLQALLDWANAIGRPPEDGPLDLDANGHPVFREGPHQGARVADHPLHLAWMDKARVRDAEGWRWRYPESTRRWARRWLEVRAAGRAVQNPKTFHSTDWTLDPCIADPRP